ncbi:AAA family ATPase [Chryseobacterium sp. 5_R23647]|uniref:AAA family ATPase n=1 Tax=Chryseobacterium sp. 5_R23647 TaxID=2258964 RepID=UPI000E25D92C|nr:AAA family ATPase [Chryseobacterium sp. 5_R23647]REC42974.1 ATP-binding protein [Chryseobacterium sp. 5_R23647]
MIQEFSFKNYLSFKEKQTISFLATSERKLRDELTYEPKKGVKLLRMALIYGANASGKSNLLQAIQALWILMYSPNYKEDELINVYNPFELFDGEPIEFDVVFWVQKRKFYYNIQFNQYEILHEKLQYTSNGGVMSDVYERFKGNEYKFGSTIDIKSKQKNDLIKETLKNHSVISTLNKKNLDVPPIFHEVYNWIKLNIHELGIYNSSIEIAEQAERNIDLRKMILDLLCKADFNIVDFNLVESRITDSLRDEIIKDKSLSEDLKNKLLEPRKELFFKHQTGDLDEFQLNFGMESSGTRIYFRLARILFELKNGNNIFMEDEIEDSLHYDLLLHYLQTYLQIESSSQLIFTTHNQMLLEEDWLIRRDMIWLVEKDKNTSSSNLKRVSELGLHKNLSLLNAYKIGKLGAKPNLGSTILNF